MLKIIHCSDIHIDSKFVGLSSDKIRIRNQEIINNFNHICKYAVENNVAAVLVCGDLFDTGTPSPQSVKAIAQIINSCKSVKFVILAGNHDGINNQLLNLTDSNHVTYIGNDFGEVIINDVRICGINLIRGKEQQQLDELRTSNSYKASILMLHCDLDVVNSVYPNINRQWFVNSPFNYFALGHIHQYSVKVLNDKVFCYSGCLSGRGYDETGSKGFVEIDIDNYYNIVYKFVPIKNRNYYTFKVDVSNAETFIDVDGLIDITVSQVSPDSLVRIELVGNIDAQLVIDEAVLLSKYSTQFFGVKIINNTHVRGEAPSGQSLKGEFLSLMSSQDCEQMISAELQSKKLPSKVDDNLKQLIIDYALKALSGGQL